jgi:hypothetical protein
MFQPEGRVREASELNLATDVHTPCLAVAEGDEEEFAGHSLAPMRREEYETDSAVVAAAGFLEIAGDENEKFAQQHLEEQMGLAKVPVCCYLPS